jgi:hypothetical protein
MNFDESKFIMVENEIPFLSWDEFRQMAPSILQLEVTRLGTLIDAARNATDFRNALVKARFEVKQFIACVRQAEKATVEAACARHLQTALLAISLVNTNLDEATTATLDYVIDRLRYVNDRVALIY